jgi:hypothetical protein
MATHVSGQSGNGSSATSFAISYSPAAGNAVVLGILLDDGTQSVLAITGQTVHRHQQDTDIHLAAARRDNEPHQSAPGAVGLPQAGYWHDDDHRDAERDAVVRVHHRKILRRERGRSNKQFQRNLDPLAKTDYGVQSELRLDSRDLQLGQLYERYCAGNVAAERHDPQICQCRRRISSSFARKVALYRGSEAIVESRISCGSRYSGKIHSASAASLRVVIALIHRPKILPLRLVSQSNPSSNRLLSRVTSYASRLPLLGLHLAWLDWPDADRYGTEIRNGALTNLKR